MVESEWSRSLMAACGTWPRLAVVRHRFTPRVPRIKAPDYYSFDPTHETGPLPARMARAKMRARPRLALFGAPGAFSYAPEMSHVG